MSFESFESNQVSGLDMNPENLHSLEEEYISGLPDIGGKFTLPAGTRIRKSNKSFESLPVDTEVVVSPISRDFARLRASGIETITPERANTLPPSECTFDIRQVSIRGDVLGTITGDRIYKVNSYVLGDHE